MSILENKYSNAMAVCYIRTVENNRLFDYKQSCWKHFNPNCFFSLPIKEGKRQFLKQLFQSLTSITIILFCPEVLFYLFFIPSYCGDFKTKRPIKWGSSKTKRMIKTCKSSIINYDHSPSHYFLLKGRSRKIAFTFLKDWYHGTKQAYVYV